MSVSSFEDICVNTQEQDGNVTSFEAACVVSWDLTGDQLVVSAYSVLALLFLVRKKIRN